MPSHAAPHVALLSSVAVAIAIAACGGEGQGPGPQVPPSPTGTGTAVTPAPSGSAAVPPGPAGADAGAAIVTPAAPKGPMKAVATSTMAEDLKKLGIDPLKPPPLNKLSPDVVRKLMPTFAKALGVQCTACHDDKNFKAWTPNKRVAAKMWSEFVVGMRMDDGSPLYCDSCHGGHMEFLDRADKKALSGWMEANFVKKLKRADKKDHSCDQCHGDPFEGKFLAAWAK
jgi:hypothetical protein